MSASSSALDVYSPVWTKAVSPVAVDEDASSGRLGGDLELAGDLLVGVRRRTGTAAGARPRNCSRRRVACRSPLTPRNATSLPRSVATCWKTGNSARHGPHHEAHLLTTTGWPLSSARRALERRRAAAEQLRCACACSAASGGGRAGELAAWPAARSKSARRRRSPSPPACVSPMTTTATSATAPRMHEHAAHSTSRVADRRVCATSLLQ